VSLNLWLRGLLIHLLRTLRVSIRFFALGDPTGSICWTKDVAAEWRMMYLALNNVHRWRCAF
jgi:hypothetical protein